MESPDPIAHDPLLEAAAVAGPGYTVRILEPGRPAVNEPPFFADDPAAVGSPEPGTVVLATHKGGDVTWDDLARRRPEVAEFAADRWLGARRNLPRLPAGYMESLVDYHRIAYSIVAEARRLANSKFGLRYTRGGFGTPFFGNDVQVRVAGDLLIVQHADQVRSQPITTLRAAGEFVGVEPRTTAAEDDSPELGDLDRELAVRADVGRFLGEWFGFATALLEEVRNTEGAVDADRVQLWPGHFDPATAVGDAATDGRATYGFSPGDEAHDEPYVYVAAWGPVDHGHDHWNDTTFGGASLSYSDLVSAPDHYDRALRFLRTGYDLLNL
jgi:hypothetical protein